MSTTTMCSINSIPLNRICIVEWWANCDCGAACGSSTCFVWLFKLNRRHRLRLVSEHRIRLLDFPSVVDDGGEYGFDVPACDGIGVGSGCMV